MSRTLGFFLGSAAVFAMLVYMLGQPVPLARPDRDAGSRQQGGLASTEPVVIPAPPARTPSPPPRAPEPVPAAAAPPAPEPVPAPAASQPPAEAVDETAPAESVPEAEPSFDENALAAEWLARDAQQGPLPDASPVGDVPGGQAWFPVWDPFHSELSANAFARRLERVTGLDYRVLRSGPAEYRVAVAYTSEEERIANVAAIEEATGLSIVGASQ